ncbi:MAG: hypothetical protein HN742_30455 [Lentisphaerae bacterium]|jgi:hypothetical protein|nr:hypothetical protein [Lentisphaerota bacterium]MBT5607603.1 hypothetical protein [Lentisphaerota bacterium]MBT7061300.1 hypothetical protein [Lentisphaerota bacterium]MBT7846234.1 hypothetical protein [Lentisphaerota bacterium]
MTGELAVVIGLFAATGLLGAAEKLTVPECAEPPVLDGVLPDPVWQSATRVDTLYLLNSDTPTRNTTVYLARNDKWLYVGLHCRNPNMKHVSQLVCEHDGAVHIDESVEVFIRPDAAVDDYYHFMLNFANAGKEQRCNGKGRRDVGWNPPWKTSTKRLPDGWTAEIAIPLFIFERADLGNMQINVSRNLRQIELDAYGSVSNERRVHHALRSDNKGSFHKLHNFLPVAGLGGFKPEPPFAPQITGAEVTGYREREGKMAYGVNVALKTGSPVAGEADLLVTEGGSDGVREAYRKRVKLDGFRRVELSVPTKSFQDRRVTVSLVGAGEQGNVLASRDVTDTSGLSLISKAFVVRSYYTTEAAAQVRLEFGLSEKMLQGTELRLEVAGKVATASKGLKPVMTVAVPMSSLAVGSNTVAIQVLANGSVLTSQELVVQRLKPNPGHEVKLDFVKNAMLDNGRPIFPVGVFGHGLQYRLSPEGDDRLPWTNPEEEEALFEFLGRDIGLNLVIKNRQARHTESYMRLAEKHGLYVIPWSYPRVAQPMGMIKPKELKALPLTETLKARAMAEGDNLPLPDRLKIRRALYEEQEPATVADTKILRTYRNLIAYYGQDEPNLLNPKDRIASAEWYWKTVAGLDLYRPKILVYAKHIPNGENWTRWADILAYDVYPGPPYRGGAFHSEPGLSTAYYAYKLRERCRRDNKIMWFVPLASMLDPGRTPIGMGKDHMLCQAYAAIIYGARGLMYFALANVVGPEAWDGLRVICRQVKEMAPAILNGDIPQEIRYTPDHFQPLERKFPAVNVAVFQYPGGDHLLMAVNVTAFAVDASLKVDGLKGAARLFSNGGNGTLAIDHESLSDRIEPYGGRAYRLRLADAPGPVRVALNMTRVADERAVTVDIPGIARQVMMSKNHMPNPCLTQQTNKGIPDFYRPYFCLSVDQAAGRKGSTWFVDDEVLWEGHPSLYMLRRQLTDARNTARGSFISSYPPTSSKPTKMTFSFYARSDSPKASLWFRIADTSSTAKPLSEDWKRHSFTFDLPPGTGRNMGDRTILVCPSTDAAVWINGLQLEAGEEATEFQDCSVVKKRTGQIGEEPGNLLRNGGAEYGSAKFWAGLESLPRGEFGVRRGVARTGEYAFCWRGQSSTIRSELVPVDPRKSYHVSGSFKSAGQAQHSLLFGLTMFDARQRPIRSWNRFSIKGTRTELVTACAPDDTVLKIRDAGGWKPGRSFAAAFGVEENQLTFDVTPLGVDKVVQEADHWRVILKRACGLTFPAGTPVMENHAAGNGIFYGSDAVLGEWTDIKGMIEPKQWWPGAAFARVVIQAKCTDGTGPFLIDDISLKLDDRSVPFPRKSSDTRR